MENCVFKEILTQDDTPLRVFLSISNDTLTIIILQNGDAWKSTVKKKSLEVLAKGHQSTLEDYCAQLLEHIKNDDSDVVFMFNNNQFTMNRVRESMRVKYFTCRLEKADYVQQAEQIMDRLYMRNLQCSEQLNVLKTQNEDLTQNKNECESKLNELVSKKSADEHEQFGQFVLILNEKKRRIQHLTELLEAFNNGRPTVNPPVKVSKKSRKKQPKASQKKETISESESSDYDSDSSFRSVDIKDQQNLPSEECEPSTSGVNFSFLDDNFTQPHALPKRMKLSKSKENNVVITQPPKSPPKTEEPEVVERSKSPEIDLSTQQLLDMF